MRDAIITGLLTAFSSISASFTGAWIALVVFRRLHHRSASGGSL